MGERVGAKLVLAKQRREWNLAGNTDMDAPA